MRAPDPITTGYRPLHIAVLGAVANDRALLTRALVDHLTAANHHARPVIVHAQTPLQVLADTHRLPPEETLADATAAKHHTATFGLTLLAGIDTPDAIQEAKDFWLRATLNQQGISYQVLYGPTPARLRQAVQAIHILTGRFTDTEVEVDAQAQADSRARPMRMRAWGCEKCSDPECEHQLFQRLLQAR